MRLTVVGCSGSCPGPDSPASCYVVEAESEGRMTRILLDLGSGALGVLQQYVDPLQVDAVFLSHLHPDHCFDISGYYVMRSFHPEGPQPQIPVYGPAGTGKQMALAYGPAQDRRMEETFDFRGYDDQPVRLGPFTVTVARVVHPVEAYAIRVEDGLGTLAYSGDTGPCAALVDLAQGADLLIAEASFREGATYPEDLHLTGKDAGKAATEAGVGTLVLTHIPPWHDKQLAVEEARPVFGGRIDVARTGATYDI